MSSSAGIHTELLLSIVTVSLYRDEELHRTINSVSSLHTLLGSQFEHLVVSPDRDCAHDQRVSYIFKERSGIYPAMNVGIDIARGRYIWLLNAGDECLDSVNVVQLIERYREDELLHLICCPVMRSYRDGTRSLYAGGITNPHQGILFTKTVFAKLGNYNEEFKAISDRLHFDLIRKSGIRRFSERTPIAIFHMDGLSSTGNGWRLTRKEYLTYVRKNPFKVIYLYRVLRLSIKLFIKG